MNELWGAFCEFYREWWPWSTIYLTPRYCIMSTSLCLGFVAGMAFIHNGSYADGPLIKEYFNDVTSPNNLDNVVGQPPGGFTSKNGFYIRVHKSIEHGHFNFTYGMYKEVPESSGGGCTSRLRGPCHMWFMSLTLKARRGTPLRRFLTTFSILRWR